MACTEPASPPSATDVRAALDAHADAAHAAQLQRFFKTGPGEYGEGDVFIGLRAPVIRAVVKRFADLPLSEIDRLLDSEVHEHRAAALAVLTARFAKAGKPRSLDEPAQRAMVELYLAALRRGRVNNWDLVDMSADKILGPWLYDRDRDLLCELADSASLWERRVALLTTFEFIRRGDASTTLDLAERLLGDRADLIQKALGWMLREVGKRVDRALLEDFLEQHAGDMGRTALSYAIEHLGAERRGYYRAK